jgi:hypothetical protein
MNWLPHLMFAYPWPNQQQTTSGMPTWTLRLMFGAILCDRGSQNRIGTFNFVIDTDTATSLLPWDLASSLMRPQVQPYRLPHTDPFATVEFVGLFDMIHPAERSVRRTISFSRCSRHKGRDVIIAFRDLWSFYHFQCTGGPSYTANGTPVNPGSWAIASR